MSKPNGGVTSSVSTEESNSRRSQVNNTHSGKRNKLWRKKKKGSHSIHTIKIHGVTSELKVYYIATHEEVPGKAEIMHKNFKEALERHTLKTHSYPQDLSDFFEKGIKPKLKEPEEPKSNKKTAQAIWNIQIKNYFKRKNILEENLVKLHSAKFS